MNVEPINVEWINGTTPINDEVVQWAESTGRILANKGLTSSTIRRFFGEMRRIQSSFKDYVEDVPMLKAKLAYDVGRKYDERRNKGIGVKLFYDVLKPGIEAVQGKKENFNRFVKIAEAIVAFHKQYYKGIED
ncbi:MAG: type III-A CRISPR-associated protein Csm2 [Lewinellaceae bacterium]|nr:type III-A CRISPR-associated protein Csm2 [Phaeodactylibacter sp.]MCB9041490.1 type III-A CRISPR-associated protein Csm2 [Lewinellaceae bacterium]